MNSAKDHWYCIYSKGEFIFKKMLTFRKINCYTRTTLIVNNLNKELFFF